LAMITDAIYGRVHVGSVSLWPRAHRRPSYEHRQETVADLERLQL
jgi:hypothetical protein